MVRGSLTLVSLLFTQLQTRVDYVKAGWITGVVVMVVGIVSVMLAEETYHKDLNYLEGEVATLP
jgi:putative MFS transporter